MDDTVDAMMEYCQTKCPRRTYFACHAGLYMIQYFECPYAKEVPNGSGD